MNETFVSADTWAKSAIKKRWFNLSEGECFDAQIFDKNLFLIDTVTFANNGILEATFGSDYHEYYAQFRKFLSENNFQIKIRKPPRQSIHEQLYKNNEGLRKGTAIELSAYLEQIKKQRTILNHASTEYAKNKKEALSELTIKEFVQAIDNYIKEYASKIEIPNDIEQIFSMLIKKIGAHAGHCMLSALCATYGKKLGINLKHLKFIADNTSSNIKPDTSLASQLKQFKEKSYINYSQLGMSENIRSFGKQCFSEEEVRGIYLFVYKGKKTPIIRGGNKNITVRKLRSALMSHEDLITEFLGLTHVSKRDQVMERAQYLLDIKQTNNKHRAVNTKTRDVQHIRVQKRISRAWVEKKPDHNTKRTQHNKLRLQKDLANISVGELMTNVDEYLKMDVLPISSQKARILDPKADRSSIDYSNPPMIDIVVLQAQMYDYKDRMVLTRLLYDILTGKLNKAPRALKLKRKIFEQCEIDEETIIKIYLSIMNHGRFASYEVFIKQA